MIFVAADCWIVVRPNKRHPIIRNKRHPIIRKWPQRSTRKDEEFSKGVKGDNNVARSAFVCIGKDVSDKKPSHDVQKKSFCPNGSDRS
jgi:hypothetical protein